MNKALCTCLCLAALYPAAGCHKTNKTTAAIADSVKAALTPTQQIIPVTAAVSKFSGVEHTNYWEILPTTDTEDSKRHTDSITFTVTVLSDGRTIIHSTPGLRLVDDNYIGISDTFTTNKLQAYTATHCTFQLQSNTLLANWDNVFTDATHSDVHEEAYGTYAGYKQ